MGRPDAGAFRIDLAAGTAENITGAEGQPAEVYDFEAERQARAKVVAESLPEQGEVKVDQHPTLIMPRLGEAGGTNQEGVFDRAEVLAAVEEDLKEQGLPPLEEEK